MTPLLRHPLPWPSGDALPWARDRGWEGVPAVGSVAILPSPHQVDGVASLPSKGISGLVVRCVGSAIRSSWHGTHGLYGFVGLAQGDHDFVIEDPLGRFLPAQLTVNVDPARTTIAEALQDLQRPALPDGWNTLIHRISLRPAPAGPRRTGSTGVWGVVLDGGGRPVPLALVQAETRFQNNSATVTTWSGPDGSYRLDLDGERRVPLQAPPTDVFQRKVSVFLPSAGSAVPQSQPWIERIPADLDNLIPRLPASGSGSGYTRLESDTTPPLFRLRDGPTSTGTFQTLLQVQIGRQKRWDILLV